MGRRLCCTGAMPLSRILRSSLVLAALLGVAAHAAPASAATYDVGPGYAKTALSQVAWQALAPGDTVRIHAQADGYHEQLWLTESGTPTAPITIEGVDGPNGEPAVIDGENATATNAAALFSGYPALQTLGVIGIYRAGHPYGYRPSHVTLSNLTIQGATRGHAFTAAGGAAMSYGAGAAGIWMSAVDHITLRDLTISGNENGLFMSSKGDEQTQSHDLLVQDSHFAGNGVPGSYLEHQVYTEGDGVVLEGNFFDRPAAGMAGSNVKDRSAGFVFRYNRVDGGQRWLDLVDAQDSAPVVVSQAGYGVAQVYGNRFSGGDEDGSNMIHYGGDTCGTSPTVTDPLLCPQIANYRKGTLYLHHNTFVFGAGQAAHWSQSLLHVNTVDEHVDLRNNIVYQRPATGAAAPALSLVNDGGTVTATANWISPGVTDLRPSDPFHVQLGTVTSVANISNPANDPGFVSATDRHLAAGSPAIDAAAPLAGAALAPVEQYVAERRRTPRPTVGAAADLGAFEFGVADPPATTVPIFERLQQGPTLAAAVSPAAGAGRAAPLPGCRVPTLRGLTLKQAKQRLKRAKCVTLRSRVRGGGRVAGRVVRHQSPRARALIRPTALGQRVVVTLTLRRR